MDESASPLPSACRAACSPFLLHFKCIKRCSGDGDTQPPGSLLPTSNRVKEDEYDQSDLKKEVEMLVTIGKQTGRVKCSTCLSPPPSQLPNSPLIPSLYKNESNQKSLAATCTEITIGKTVQCSLYYYLTSLLPCVHSVLLRPFSIPDR